MAEFKELLDLETIAQSAHVVYAVRETLEDLCNWDCITPDMDTEIRRALAILENVQDMTYQRKLEARAKINSE